jgi:hypothetical protein
VEVLIQYGNLPPCYIAEAQFQNFPDKKEAQQYLSQKENELSKISQEPPYAE